ncbi:DUF3060 domain-containing protein [Microbacterium sp. CGR1]|uniref:DUF3060 domain-containing protein n=1 Tax=Microbacterium sp. CGR1 TaxID=1696072 RepID=UPI003DA434FA
MRRTKATPALLAALLLVTALSGCSVSIVDPTRPTPVASTPPERSAPDQPETSPDTTGEEPSSEPTSESELSADGQAERSRLIAAATTTMPCPSAPLTEDGAVIRIEGACPELVVEIDAGVVIADDVGTLSLSGSGTVIYVQNVGAVTVTGSASSIFWEGDTPTVQDRGSANTLRRG